MWALDVSFKSKSSLGVQDIVSSTFQKFHDLLRLFRPNSHFFQSCAKVFEKRIEVSVVQPVTSGPRTSIMNTHARIHDSPSEEHGNEQTLPRAEMRHISSFKEVPEALVFQNFLVEGFRGSPDGAPSTDQVI